MKVNVKGVPSYQLEWKFVKGVEKVPVPCLLHTPSQTYIPNWLLLGEAEVKEYHVIEVEVR